MINILVWWVELTQNVPPLPSRKVKFIFTTIREGGSTITGEIKSMKKEFGWSAEFEAVAEGPAGSDYEHGTEKWAVVAADKDGNDRSGDYAVEPHAENPLRCKVTHSGTQESFGALSLSADGDPDADETAPVRGSIDFITDAPNVTGFALSEVPPVE